MMTGTADPDPSKLRKAWFFRGFRDRYCLGYVRKHFHAVRISKDSSPIPDEDMPVIVVLNHPSWWDPLLFVVLSREFGDREHYGVIDQPMLSKYGFFKWLGVFGVESKSMRGAARFLRMTTKLLTDSNRVFWITAQGRFTDVRERPLNLQSGVGHLAARLKQAIILPVALEYCFWNEKAAEVLMRIGEPIRIGDNPTLSGSEWTERIELVLTGTLDQLNADAQTRDTQRFRTILGGCVGVGGIYGIWQRLKSWARLRPYRPNHDDANN